MEQTKMKTQPDDKKQAVLFYSYSHKDERYRDALAKHLALLKRQGVIKEWYDREITPGEEWTEAIDENLEAADIVLLLVSADFIASDYCYGKEMIKALERNDKGEAHVIPIIVRPVNWKGAPFGRLEALPKNGKAVTLWANRDAAWVDVANGIARTVDEVAAGLPAKHAIGGPPTVPKTMTVPVKKFEPLPAVRPGGQLRRTIYDASDSFELPGKVARSEGDPATGDAAVDEAYDGLGITYNFFWDIYGRNSIDDKGMQLVATVHYGQSYSNAFWSGKQAIFGDGDGKIFNRFTIAVEIIADTIAYGIISNEVQLNYWQQSGALQESLSNVFGSLVKQYALKQTADQAEWLLGAGLLASGVKGKALGSMIEPGTAYDDPVIGKDSQQAHMRNYVRTTADNGGVRLNSGIPNHAFCLIAIALGGYAWEKAGRIWYESLRDKRLKPDAQFRDFARITLANARRLYGDNSDEAEAVKDGWETVGIKVVKT